MLRFFLALWLAFVPLSAWAGSMTLMGVGSVGGGGACSPSYVTGDRRASITVTNTNTGTPLINAGTLAALVDGSFTTVSGPLGSVFFTSGRTPAEQQRLIFDYGSGNTKLVTEAKWYQDISTAQGTWQWYGSTDAVTLTAAIGSTFTLGGVAGAQVQTSLNGNTTAYRSYILVMTAGTTNNASWEEEIEFKQCP